MSEPPEPAGLACGDITLWRKPVLFAYHLPEGGWQFSCGKRHKAKDLRAVDAGLFFGADRALQDIAKLPRGIMARREDRKSPWSLGTIEPGTVDGLDVEAPLPAEVRIAVFEALVAENETDENAWYELARVHFETKNWQRAADAAQRSATPSSDRGHDAAWMLGVAATALRDWELARTAWRGCGLDVDSGPGPVWGTRYVALVRLPNLEVVWGEGVDYARVQISNVPTPQSGFRWHDIVLHDGEWSGQRKERDVVMPIFDVIERWSASEIPTLHVDTRCATDADAQRLSVMFEEKQFVAEDWSGLYLVEGSVSGQHRPTPVSGYSRAFGIASPLEVALVLLAEWQRESVETRSYDAPVVVC